MWRRAAGLRFCVLRRLLHQEVPDRAAGGALDPLPQWAGGEQPRVPSRGPWGSLPIRPPAPRGSRSSLARHPTAPPRQVPIPITPGLDPLSLLTDAADVAAWSNQGLPSDRTSTENATILCHTKRWPLVVDAQLQGIKWLKNKYGEELRAIRLGQRRWVRCCRVLPARAPASPSDLGPLRTAALMGHPTPPRAPQGLSGSHRGAVAECAHPS